MKPSNIGGQAVMEGIMMRHKDKYSIAVRRPDKEIELKVEDYKCIFGNGKLWKKPIIRGVVSFVESLVIGTKCLMFSAEIAGDEEDEEEAKKNQQLTAEELPNPDEEKDLPNVIVAILPIILILVMFNNPMHPFPVETSVFAGVALATILMFKRIKGVNEWIGVFNKGAADSGVAILNTAIVVGFGGVVQNTQGFNDLVTALKNMSMQPLVFVMITVAICAGACGSASGGMGVAFNALKDTYLQMGVSLPYVHRIAAIAAGTLDTLPHQGAQITLLGICKLTHKEAYWDIAVTQIFIPFICCGVFILLAQLGL